MSYQMFAAMMMFSFGRRGSEDKGACCTYFKYDNTSGVKIYSNPRTRDACVKLQKIFHKLGFAPAVLNVFDFGTPCLGQTGYKREYFGYATESVIIQDKIDAEIQKTAKPEDYPYLIIDSYIVEMKDYFYRTFRVTVDDMHCQNFGWNENGFQVIDFDHVYCADTESWEKAVEKLEKGTAW